MPYKDFAESIFNTGQKVKFFVTDKKESLMENIIFMQWQSMDKQCK